MTLLRDPLSTSVYGMTFRDAIDHIRRYLGGITGESIENDLAESVMDAYRELVLERRWAYLYTPGRINLIATQTSSTVTYDHTGGAYERMLTIAAGTWPSTSADGTIRIAGVDYEVRTYETTTIITLDSVFNPGADVAAGTAYSLFFDNYALPPDCQNLGEINDRTWSDLTYVHPHDWMHARRIASGSGIPTMYTILPDRRRHDQLSLRVYPYPSDARTLDFIYYRAPRPLVWRGDEDDAKAGTVVANGTTTLTGTSTNFQADMVGSVIRIGTDATNQPTDRTGSKKFYAERIIAGYTSATSITLDSAVTTTASGRAYTVSDPIDLPWKMQTAFKRCLENQAAIIRIKQNGPAALQAYQMALGLAADNDDPSFAPRQVGGRTLGRNFAPTGDDQLIP